MSISQRRQNVYYLTPFNAFTVAVSSAPNLQSSRARMPRGAVSQLKALGEKRQDAIPNSVSIPLSGDGPCYAHKRRCPLNFQARHGCYRTLVPHPSPRF
jgi:hypothetical protein